MNDNYKLPNTRKYPWYLVWLLRWLQRRCQHYALKADILESCDRVYSVRWCETCGGVWVVVDGTPQGWLRMCEPTFET
jgi:hypothetical protein